MRPATQQCAGPRESGRDGLERLRHTPFDLNSTLRLEVPAWHTQKSSRDWNTDPLESFRQVKNRCYRSWISSSCMTIASVLSNKVSHTARSAPPLRSSVASHSKYDVLLPFSNLWLSQGFPPTNQRWHKRNGTLARDDFRNQDKHRCASLLRPSPTLFHLLQEFHHLSSCVSRSSRTLG